MKAYDIIETNNEANYKCLVVATSYVCPLDTFEQKIQLENELQERNLQGLVLFDLLLCNGLAPNRFVACNFKGNRLDTLNDNIVTDVHDTYKEISCRYLRENPLVLERGILPNAQIFLLKNGYTL
jgi:hypothetical protein